MCRWVMSSRPVLCRAEIPRADCRHLRGVAQVSLLGGRNSKLLLRTEDP